MVDRTVTITLRRKREIYERKTLTVRVTDQHVLDAPIGNGDPDDPLDVESAAEALAEKADDGSAWETYANNTEALDSDVVQITPPMKPRNE